MGKDNMNVARSDCSIGSKDEIEWISANSLVKCQNWAENKCNATIAVYWPENWCEGYTWACKYGEEAYNVNSIVHFCKKEWSCERNRRCAKDNMNVARSDCSIGSKDEIEWISANSLEKCQNWAENKCNATIAVYWPENWCEGYTTSCKYGEEAYNVNSIVHFCKKEWSCERNRRCAKDNMNVA